MTRDPYDVCVCGHYREQHIAGFGCPVGLCGATDDRQHAPCTAFQRRPDPPVPIHRGPSGYADDVVAGHPFNTVGSEMNYGPFDYTDRAAWAEWLIRIGRAAEEHDAWGLLVQRPDTDMILVDLQSGWADRVHAFNGRTVWLLRPVGWSP